MMVWMDDFEELGDVVASPVAVVTTESSVWLVDASTYVRLPLAERQSARSDPSPWGRLRDGTRFEHRRAFWVRERSTGDLRLRILPCAGPKDGHGIVTGRVTKVSGVGEGDPSAVLGT